MLTFLCIWFILGFITSLVFLYQIIKEEQCITLLTIFMFIFTILLGIGAFILMVAHMWDEWADKADDIIIWQKKKVEK